MSRQGDTPHGEDQIAPAHGEIDDATIDLVQVIDRSVAQLWETIESLERLEPRNRERFRVSVFGSSRIAPQDPLYRQAEDLGRRLAEGGCEIVTGGGGGLMRAVDMGAARGAQLCDANGGLPVRLVAESGAPFVEMVYRHRTFFSRLHHFVRLSSAFIVFPGGIGSTLETMMVWQLLQARHLPPTPFLLFGDHWRGLVRWIEGEAAANGYVTAADLELPTLVDTVDDAVAIILAALEEFRESEECRVQSNPTS